MKYLIAAGLLLSLAGCFGNSAVDNELSGQVKKVMHNTPLLCMDYDIVDVSLGVIRNGVGSISGQDVWLWVPNKEDYKKLQDAAKSGKIVNIKYNQARMRLCVEEREVTSVEVIEQP